RHHHHVTALQQDVLLQVFLLVHISVSEQEDLLNASSTTHDLDVVFRCIGREASRHSQRLQHVCMVADQKLSGLVHTPDDIDAITENFEHRNCDVRVREKLAQPLDNFIADILCSSTRCRHVSNERKGDHSVGSYHRFLCEMFIFPNRNLQHVFRTEQ